MFLGLVGYWPRIGRPASGPLASFLRSMLEQNTLIVPLKQSSKFICSDLIPSFCRQTVSSEQIASLMRLCLLMVAKVYMLFDSVNISERFLKAIC